MKPHRISLTQDELDIIVVALTSRLAGYTGKRRYAMYRLAERLAEGGRGNPNFRFGLSQTEHPSRLKPMAGLERPLETNRVSHHIPE